jgi:hypothetical protein
MTNALAWIITALVLIILAAFVLDVISLRSLPTEERPATATYDRLGRFIGRRENPDYHENPGETEEEEGGST